MTTKCVRLPGHINLIVCVAAFSALAVLAPRAYAVPVMVTGGFTSFEGVVLGSGNPTFALSTLNGQPLCAVSGCEFTDVAHVDFSTPQSSLLFFNSSDGVTQNLENQIVFTPATTQQVSGIGINNPFQLGTFTYSNGIWSGDATFAFTLTAQSTDTSLDGLILTDVLTLRITPNVGTPLDNADFVYFSGTPSMGSLRAYELVDSPTGVNTFTADVFGYFDSLHLLAFANGTGGGFLDPGIDIAPTPPTPVSEPTSLALVFAGVLVLSAAQVRRAGRADK